MRLPKLLRWLTRPTRAQGRTCNRRPRFQLALEPLEDRTVFATHFLLSGLPTLVTAGTPATIMVTAQNADNSTDTLYSGTVQFASSDGRAVLPGQSALASGIGYFSVTLFTAGTQSVTVSDANSIVAIQGQSNLVVGAAVTSQFLVSGLTSPITAGVAGSITVTAADPYGNRTSGYRGLVHFISSDVQAILPADQALTTGSGTFSVTLKTAGVQTLTATDTVNSSITGSLGDIPQTAPIYVQTPNASGGGVKSAWYAPGGQGLDGDQYVWDSFTLGSSQAINEIRWRGFYAYASYGSPNIPSSPVSDFTISIYPTSPYPGVNEPNIFAAPIVQYSTGGLAGQTPAGTFGGMPMYNYAFTLPVAFQAVAGTRYWLQIEASQGVAPLTSWPPDWNIAFGTGGDGLYFQEIIGGTLAGGNQYRTVTGNDTAFSLVTYTNAPGVVVNSAAMSRLSVTGFGSPTTAGMAGNVTVMASDPFGNITPGYPGTVHFTSSDAKAVLPADATLTNGMGTFSATLETAGTQSLTVTDTAFSALHGSQSGIAVIPGTAYSMTMETFPSAMTVSTTHPLTITLWDSYGNVATGYTGTVTFSSTDPQAILPADYPFLATDKGTHTFSTTLNTVGTWSLSAHDTLTSNLANNQSNIHVYPPIRLGSLSFGEWTANRGGYSGTIAVSGGAGGYTRLSVIGLPAGIRPALNGNTVTLGGTPTTAGTFPFTVSLFDSAGIAASQNLSFTVEPTTTLVWTGHGGDNLWSDAANWSGAIPVAGNILDFGPGALQKMTVNDLAPRTLFNAIRFEESGYTLTGNAIRLSGGIQTTNAMAGTDSITLNIALTANQTVSVGPSSVLQLQGVLSGASFGLNKVGSGTLAYTGSAANTYTGSTAVTGGVLVLNNAVGNALAGPLTVGAGAIVSYANHDNQVSDTATVTIATGGTLNLSGRNDKVGGLVLNGGAVTTGTGTLILGGNITSNAASGPATLSGALDLGGMTRTVTVAHGTAAEDLVLAATVSNGGLTKAGPGALVLSGNNTYAGLTMVSAGVLDVQNASALGTAASGTTVAAGATLEIESDNGVFFTDALTLGSAAGSATLLMLGGYNTWAGNISLPATSTINVAAGQLTLGGVLSGTGGVTKVGAGTLVYSGSAANMSKGLTTVSAGQLQLNCLAGSAIAGALTVGAGASVLFGGYDNQVSDTSTVTVGAGGTFDLNGRSDMVGALVLNGGTVTTGTGTLILGGNITSNATAAPATINGNFDLGSVTHTVTVASGTAVQSLILAANIRGAGGLIKAGTGVLVLSGNNTFTGLTTVRAGTLGGTGVPGAVTLNVGSHLAPGAGGPASFTSANVNFTLGSSFDVNITGAGSDQLVSTGSVALNGATLNVSLGSYMPPPGTSFAIITRTSAGAGNSTFAGLPEGKMFHVGSTTFQITYVGGTGHHDVVLTVL